MIDLPGGGIGICLEDLTLLPESPWEVETYRRVAHASADMVLACEHAAAELSSETWLSRGWLRSYVRRHDSDAWRLRDHQALTQVRTATDDATLGGLLRLWADRSALLALLDQLTQTLCHFDLSIANVFARGDPPTAIDWAFVGWGPTGSDVGGFALESALDFRLPPGDIPGVRDEMHARFRSQLLEVASELPAVHVDFALHAVAAVKFACVLPAVMWGLMERPATFNGLPTEQGLDMWRQCLPHVALHGATALARAGRVQPGR